MNSKLLFIAFVSLFFQGIMTATVPSNLEDVKTVTNGSVIEHVVNGTKPEAINGNVTGVVNGTKPEAINGNVTGVVNGTKPGATNGNVTGVVNGTKPEAINGNVTGVVNGTKPGATNGNVTGVVNGTKPEATNGSNTTEMSDGIEYRNSSTAAPTSLPSTNQTVKPEPVPTKTTETTVKPPSSTPATVKPEPVPTKTTETSVKAPSSTPATVVQTRSFDAPNFIGGIILTLGLTAIGFVAYKFYKARKAEANYRTL